MFNISYSYISVFAKNSFNSSNLNNSHSVPKFVGAVNVLDAAPTNKSRRTKGGSGGEESTVDKMILRLRMYLPPSSFVTLSSIPKYNYMEVKRRRPVLKFQMTVSQQSKLSP